MSEVSTAAQGSACRGRQAAVCLSLFSAVALAVTATLTVPKAARAIAPGDIVLGDITVIKLRTAASGLSAQERADKVQERINEVLAIPKLTAKDVKIVQKPPYGPTIYIHGVKIVTVDKSEAEMAGTTADELAKSWAHRLMGVIGQVNIRLPEGTPKPTTTPTPETPETPNLPAPPDAPMPGQPAPPVTTPAPTPPTPATPDPGKGEPPKTAPTPMPPTVPPASDPAPTREPAKAPTPAKEPVSPGEPPPAKEPAPVGEPASPKEPAPAKEPAKEPSPKPPAAPPANPPANGAH